MAQGEATTQTEATGPGDWQVALRFARLTGGFWLGPSAGKAWFWSVLLAAGIVIGVFANVTVNRWNGWFFDALETKDAGSALVAMAVFPVIGFVVAGLGVVILIARETFQVYWREWVAAKLADGWIGGRRFFRLSLSATSRPIPNIASPMMSDGRPSRWSTSPSACCRRSSPRSPSSASSGASAAV